MSAIDNYCYVLDTEPKTIGQMGDFLVSKSKKSLYIDTNIIPFLTPTQVEGMSREQIIAVTDFNKSIMNVFGRPTVTFTSDVKKETQHGLSGLLNILNQVFKKPDKYQRQLIQSFEYIDRALGARKTPSEQGVVYQACYDITCSIIEALPYLKSDDETVETDERLVAHAFAHIIEAETPATLFTNDKRIQALAKKMYKLLVAVNMGGDTHGVLIWTPGRVERQGIEVYGFGKHTNGSGKPKNMFVEKFSKKRLVPKYKWDPPPEAPSTFGVVETKSLKRAIREEIAAIEEALENPAAETFMDVITGTGKGKTDNPDDDESEKPPERKPEGLTGILKDIDTVRIALSPDAKLDDLSEKEVSTILRRYRAFKRICERGNLSTDGIEEEIKKYSGKTLAAKITALTVDTQALIKQKRAIEDSDPLLSNTVNRKKVGELDAQINEYRTQIQDWQQQQTDGAVARQTVAFQPSERDFFEALQKAGYHPEQQGGDLVPMALLQKISGYKASSLSVKLSKLESENVIPKRIKQGREKLVRVSLDTIPRLVKQR
jgi:hypothetical protein